MKIRRADLRITDPDGQDYLLDVTFTSPTCPSSIERAHSDTEVLGAATKAAQLKLAQYSRFIQGHEKFVSFALEVDGGMHDEAINFVKRLARSAYNNDSCPFNHAEVYTAIISEIAVATQIGNFRTFRRNLNNNIKEGFVVRSAQAHSHDLDDDEAVFFGDDRDLPPQQPHVPASPHTPERKADREHEQAPAQPTPESLNLSQPLVQECPHHGHQRADTPSHCSSMSGLELPPDRPLHSRVIVQSPDAAPAQQIAPLDGLTEPVEHSRSNSQQIDGLTEIDEQSRSKSRRTHVEDPGAEFDRLAQADPTVHSIVAINPALHGVFSDPLASQHRDRSPSVLSYSTDREQEGSQTTFQAHLQQHSVKSSRKPSAQRKIIDVEAASAASGGKVSASENDDEELAQLFSRMAGTDSDSGARGGAADEPDHSG